MIACTHPGKIGDALYALPSMRWYAHKFGTQVDFYTSEHCRPLLKLVEYQSFVNKAYVAPNYVIQNKGQGVQPWRVPVDISLYQKVIHMGFRTFPDRPLHEFIAGQTGVPTSEISVRYDYPNAPTLDEPYVVVAPKGRTTFTDTLLEFFSICPVKIVQVGAKGEELDYDGTVNKCGEDMLDTLPWIAGSKGFVGFLSSQLVLAQGFLVPRVAVCPDRGWRRAHVPKTALNHYLINPTPQQILESLNL